MSRVVRLVLVAVLVFLATGCVPEAVRGEKITVTAYFGDSAGLFVGNDVGVLGVPIGKVTDIEPDGDRVKVTMEIDADRAVPADAGAVVVARSVATDRYVELTPVYDGGEKLADGAEIDVDRTASPVDFDEVLETINDFATGIAGSKKTTQAVKRFIDSGAAALQGNGELFNRSTRELAQAISTMSGQRKDFAETIVSLDVLVGSIAENDQTVRTFIEQVADASSLLADERGNFRKALRALDRAVTVVAQFAVDNRDAVVETFDETTKVFRTMLSKRNALNEVLRVMPVALENLMRLPVNGRIPTRVDPLTIAPLGEEIRKLCQQLPLGLCDLLSGTDPDLPLGLGGRP
ncbi:MAG TPA: MCE family protein [Nocardioides sp.]|nr:MCE family protein [Nocardioides sp.]